MTTDASNVWNNQMTQQFAEALTTIVDGQAMQNFLRDVMTEKEIIETSARLEAAKMLTKGERYTDVIKRTKLSSRTVALISDWLKNGCNGYQTALTSLDSHNSHISPVSAE
jgi:TrpR-related protein YerC/YecD